MDLSPKHLQELLEASKSLTSNDTKVKLSSMRQIVQFYGQGNNCETVNHLVAKLDPKDSITLRRFRNMFSVSYSLEDSETQSDAISAIMADFENKDPLIKSMAVSQAGFFTTEETSSILIPIILKASSMDDPYIRKTAAHSILKVFQNNPYFISQYNLDLTLHSLLDDENPNVVSNCINTISEINSSLSSPIIKISINSIDHMLSILEDASEWSQIQIIDFITENMPPNPEAVNQLDIINRLSTRLYYANPGLTVSTVRCSLKMCQIKKNQEWTKEVLNKVMPPLIFLLNERSEIQYIVLRSITVILQKYKSLFSDDVNFFFCQKDDTSFIKSEKLDIIWILASESNSEMILNEISKYPHDKDVKFARKSIQVIGKLSIMFENVSDNCVEIIISLLQSPEIYIVQECVIASVSILRKYPFKKRFENLISAICMNFNAAVDDHHRSKAAMAWILGEYAGMITNAAEHIEAVFLENFLEEPTDVQLSTLTAVVKYYLIFPEEGQELLKKVLTLASNSVDNPDLKDHALIYLSILTECAESAADIILSKKNKKLLCDIRKNDKNVESESIEISETSEYSEESESESETEIVDDFESINLELGEMNVIDPKLADSLLPLVGSLAVMYKQLPEAFIPRNKEVNIDLDSFSSSQFASGSIGNPSTPSSMNTTPPSKLNNFTNHSSSTALLKTKSKFNQKMQMNINFDSSSISHRHSSTKRAISIQRDFGSFSEEERNCYDTPTTPKPSAIQCYHHRNKSFNYAHYIYNNEYNFNYNINEASNASYLNSSDAEQPVNNSFGQIRISKKKKSPEMLDEILNQQSTDDGFMMANSEIFKKRRNTTNEIDEHELEKPNNDNGNSLKKT